MESSGEERALLILKVRKMQNRIYSHFSRIEVLRSFEEEAFHYGVVLGAVGLASLVSKSGETILQISYLRCNTGAAFSFLGPCGWRQ